MAPPHHDTDEHVTGFQLGPDLLARFPRRPGTQERQGHEHARRGELLSRLAISLIEAGFVVHDCPARPGTGGVCLTTSSEQPCGVIVTWTTHDVLCLDPDRHDGHRAVLDTMNFALGDVLLGLGYDVRKYGSAGVNIVLGPATVAEPAQEVAAMTGGVR